MIRLVAVAAAAVLGACATTGGDLADFVPARLVDASDPELRELMRVYVRERLGPDYLIDPDELAAGSTLTATLRKAPAMIEPRLRNEVEPAAEQVFQLEAYPLENGMICHLRQVGAESVLVLTKAECVPIG